MNDINPIEVQKYLKGVDYPTSKAELIKKAEENSAPKEIIDALTRVSMNDFNKPTDVEKALANRGEEENM